MTQTNLNKIKMKCWTVFFKGWGIVFKGFFITIFSVRLVCICGKKNIACVVSKSTISYKAAESVAPIKIRYFILPLESWPPQKMRISLMLKKNPNQIIARPWNKCHSSRNYLVHPLHSQERPTFGKGKFIHPLEKIHKLPRVRLSTKTILKLSYQHINVNRYILYILSIFISFVSFGAHEKQIQTALVTINYSTISKQTIFSSMSCESSWQYCSSSRAGLPVIPNGTTVLFFKSTDCKIVANSFEIHKNNFFPLCCPVMLCTLPTQIKCFLITPVSFEFICTFPIQSDSRTQMYNSVWRLKLLKTQ